MGRWDLLICYKQTQESKGAHSSIIAFLWAVMAPRTRALKTHGAGVICLFIGENATKRKKTAGGQECFVTVILLVKAVRARGLSTHDNRGICILALPNKSCIKTCSVVISGHPMGLKLDQGFQEHRSQCSCQQGDWFIFCYKQIFSKT